MAHIIYDEWYFFFFFVLFFFKDFSFIHMDFNYIVVFLDVWLYQCLNFADVSVCFIDESVAEEFT